MVVVLAAVGSACCQGPAVAVAEDVAAVVDAADYLGFAVVAVAVVDAAETVVVFVAAAAVVAFGAVAV